jgi:hypothetical protein
MIMCIPRMDRNITLDDQCQMDIADGFKGVNERVH